MRIVLAATWNPRGETPRLHRLFPFLEQEYAGLALSLPPEVDLGTFKDMPWLGIPGDRWRIVVNEDWGAGRYMALQEALHLEPEAIHYADLDRLLRWVETRPEEWRMALKRLAACDFLVMGRTPRAYDTHPQALVLTENVSNQVVSRLVGWQTGVMDCSAGSKGLSGRAARFLIEHTRPGRALGTDGEWTVMLHRAGFKIEYMEVDGLDWESADRYQIQAADARRQQMAAEAYDADLRHWIRRLEVATEIVAASLEASERPIPRIVEEKV